MSYFTYYAGMPYSFSPDNNLTLWHTKLPILYHSLPQLYYTIAHSTLLPGTLHYLPYLSHSIPCLASHESTLNFVGLPQQLTSTSSPTVFTAQSPGLSALIQSLRASRLPIAIFLVLLSQPCHPLQLMPTPHTIILRAASIFLSLV